MNPLYDQAGKTFTQMADETGLKHSHLAEVLGVRLKNIQAFYFGYKTPPIGLVSDLADFHEEVLQEELQFQTDKEAWLDKYYDTMKLFRICQIVIDRDAKGL